MEFSRGFNRERCFLSIHYFNSATWGNFIIPFCCFSCLASSNYSRSSLSYLPETRSGKESVAQLNAWPLLTIGRLFVIRVGPLLDRAQTPTALIIGRVGTNKTITGLEPLDFQADQREPSLEYHRWLASNRKRNWVATRKKRKEISTNLKMEMIGKSLVSKLRGWPADRYRSTKQVGQWFSKRRTRISPR